MTKPPRLAKKDLSHVNLATDDLAGADVPEATLRHADLQQTDRSGADRTDADLTEANLRGASLRDATATDATLKGADLREGNRVTAELASAELDPTASGSTHSHARCRPVTRRARGTVAGPIPSPRGSAFPPLRVQPKRRRSWPGKTMAGHASRATTDRSPAGLMRSRRSCPSVPAPTPRR